MSFKTLMVIKAVVCLMFGVGSILAPAKLLSLFGVALNDGGTFPAREYGAALFGNMVLAWSARNATLSDARTAIMQALFVYDGIGVAVTVAAILSGILNVLGWSVVVVYLFFTVGFGYFLLYHTAPKGQAQGI